ncbi:RluA family pseudouridine synthase [Curvibacter sp. CHRR-16]|uniref:RluA family pseudouridine synthase n=1 Tax=Curvibacter sp. CHRR-16 TaxID=2835872 RepID=UPI001BD95FD1|nr:RluA family pseudouridine synthase [Curvibacter sp. CHRR-16]MBT0571604.1 RluA family pseudouridine synthase [Curvibacter sp. CHRR-16]
MPHHNSAPETSTYTPPVGGEQWLHADDHLVVVCKPAGLLSVPGRGEDKQDCLSSRVQARYPDALVVHRLDRDTSGIVIMARGLEAQRALNLSFEKRLVDKRYEALVDGILPVEETWQEIDLPIVVDWPNRPRRIIDAVHGQHALTRWRCLGHVAALEASRVELEPFTGRTHQLRVHMQALGHPMLGDSLYAPPAVLQRAPRLLLHARYLQVPHPHTGTLQTFEAPPPF